MIADLDQLADLLRQIGCLKDMILAAEEQMRKLGFIGGAGRCAVKIACHHRIKRIGRKRLLCKKNMAAGAPPQLIQHHQIGFQLCLIHQITG